jgi:hypothetical protein
VAARTVVPATTAAASVFVKRRRESLRGASSCLSLVIGFELSKNN